MKDNIEYRHVEKVHNFRSPEIVLPVVFQFIKPSSILDVGCGLGTWLNVANRYGIADIFGVDGPNVNAAHLCIPAERFLAHNLRLPLDLKRKFDLAICLEVAEHLLEADADVLIDSLTQHADIILFSAAVPYQGGQNHYNEKPTEYWEEKFKKREYSFYDVIRPFIWENRNVDWWYIQNAFLVSKVNLDDKINYKELPRIKDFIHPFLYQYRINNIVALKKNLRLRENQFDNYFLMRPSKLDLLRLFLGLK